MNEAPRPEFPKEITRYYEEVAEEGRLAAGPSQLEFARTKEVVLRYLSPPPATILDVGGAAGAYALWLAERGYQVHLIDPVPRLVEEARRRSEASPNRICTCQVGDALELTFSDGVNEVQTGIVNGISLPTVDLSSLADDQTITSTGWFVLPNRASEAEPESESFPRANVPDSQ